MPVTLQRLVEIRHFLTSAPQAGGERSFFVGSSVLLEGIDCDVIDKNFSASRKFYNISWTGGDPLQWLLLLPALQKSAPRETVLCVDLIAMTRLRPVPDNILAVAAWWKFIPPNRLEHYKKYFSDDEYSILSSSPLKQLFAFRSFLPSTLDGYVREISRSELRYDGYENNFKNPWVRRNKISQRKLERALTLAQEKLENKSVDDSQAKLLNYIVASLTEGGTTVYLVLTPVNPAIDAAVREPLVQKVSEALGKIASGNKAFFVDCSALLPAGHFADDVHPDASGRREWSSFMTVAIKKNLP